MKLPKIPKSSNAEKIKKAIKDKVGKDEKKEGVNLVELTKELVKRNEQNRKEEIEEETL